MVNGVNVIVDTKLLLNDVLAGTDEGNKSWYAEPHSHCTLFEKGEKITKIGTFRSPDCKRFGYFHENMCHACSQIPLQKSFRKRLLLRNKMVDDDGNRDTTKINNMYLLPDEAQEKLHKQASIIQQKDSQLFFTLRKGARLTARILSADEKLAEFSRRGSMKSISHQLTLAEEEGKFKDQGVLKSWLETISRNLHVQNKGQRYQALMKIRVKDTKHL